MPGAVSIVVALATCLSVLCGLLYPVKDTDEAFITWGPAEQPTTGRRVALALLAIAGAWVCYVMARESRWIGILLVAPVFYGVLLFLASSNRSVRALLLKGLMACAGVLAVAGLLLGVVPALWQAGTTRTIPFMERPGWGIQVSVDEDPFGFWLSVAICCFWIWLVLALAKSAVVYRRRGVSLVRYGPAVSRHHSDRSPP